MGQQWILFVMAGFLGLSVLVVWLLFGTIVRMWLMCTLSGAKISAPQLVGMKLRRSPVKHLCELYIMATQAGLDIRLSQIESAYKAGADVELAVRAMIKAARTGPNLSWEEVQQKSMTDQYDDYVEDNYGDPS